MWGYKLNNEEKEKDWKAGRGERIKKKNKNFECQELHTRANNTKTVHDYSTVHYSTYPLTDWKSLTDRWLAAQSRHRMIDRWSLSIDSWQFAVVFKQKCRNFKLKFHDWFSILDFRRRRKKEKKREKRKERKRKRKREKGKGTNNGFEGEWSRSREFWWFEIEIWDLRYEIRKKKRKRKCLGKKSQTDKFKITLD